MRLRGGPLAAPAAFAVGASNTVWAGIPLPFELPTALGCWVNVSQEVTVPTATDGLGVAIVPLAIPSDVNLIGGRVFTQFVCVDLGANQLGVTLSNGVVTVVGGVR